MNEIAELIATLRLAALAYAGLVERDASSGSIDFSALSADRLALATELEGAAGRPSEAIAPVARMLRARRQESSPEEIVKLLERSAASLADRAYLEKLPDAAKMVLERISDAAGRTLLAAERALASSQRATRGDVDGLVVSKGDDRRDDGRADGGRGEDNTRSADEGMHTFPVWFGTNRAPFDVQNPSKGFSGERSVDGVRHGRCHVHIPESHRIGSLGSGLLRRIFTGDDRLKVQKREVFPATDFWNRLHRAANDEERGRHAVVFIHGYNVPFDEAALRAAQLGHDLGVNGPMAFFSWPSKGKLLSYFADGNSLEASTAEITDFLVSIATLEQIETVHVIAHSMGNRGALAAVTAMAADAERLSGKRFGQFILAAADVDAEVFRRGAAAYGQVGSGTTLYVSPNDMALRVSARISDFARVGRTPPVSIIGDVETIDAGAVDLGGLGHGYVAEARSVLADIHQLISTGQRAESRFGLERCDTEAGTHWRFKRSAG